MRRGFGAVLALTALVATAGSVMAAKPPVVPMYANDTTVYMSAPANAHANGGVNNAQDFYMIVYPALPSNGAQPLCNNSCAGPPDLPPTYDVVLEGAPGFGTNGTSGSFNPHWHVLVLVYSPKWLANPSFAPVQSGAELDAGEAAGHFIPIAPGTSNPFEQDTGVDFLCVIVSSHA